jgi:DNA-binding protein YbaB
MTSARKSDIDCLRARRDELVNMIERTRARVEAAEAAKKRADEFKAEMQQRVWLQEVRPGLGVMTMDCKGNLRSLRLNPAEVRLSDPAQLGARILAAIHEAESQINAAQREGLAAIFKYVTD